MAAEDDRKNSKSETVPQRFDIQEDEELIFILEDEYGVIKGQNTGRKNPTAEVEIVRNKIKASDS